ncbi:MAG TPA: hypothetical protein VJ756_01135 [Terriglobales bacterium]|nr:hypothetical protein [Terriglobales bacterium]
MRWICTLLVVCALMPLALSQETTPPSEQQVENQNTTEGTVVSSSRQTLVVRTENNQYRLYVFDRNTSKPKVIPTGASVRVVSTPGEEPDTWLASNVTVLGEAPGGQGTAATSTAAPVPRQVRDVEGEIRHEARRWRLGVRAGAALDPELIMFGVHSQMGPIFNRNVLFRPSAEFDWGEVTDLIALNLEAIYRLPIMARRRNWSAYVGAGPALTFLHQNFETQQGQGRNIDFGNFDFDTGFNILTGVRLRRGTFVEIKTSLYARPAPTLRLIFGKDF